MRLRIAFAVMAVLTLTACSSSEAKESETTEATTDIITTQIEETTLTQEATTQEEAAFETQEAVVTEPIDKIYIINGNLIHLPASLEDMGDSFSFGLYPSFGENTTANEFCYKGEVIATAISDKYNAVGEDDREVNIYNIYDFTEGADILEIDKGENIKAVIEKVGEPKEGAQGIYSFEIDGRDINIKVENEQVVSWEVIGGKWYE